MRGVHQLTLALALLAFAGNSLLCRLALVTTDIGPGRFTALRLLAGALTLMLIVALRGDRGALSWQRAAAGRRLGPCCSTPAVSATPTAWCPPPRARCCSSGPCRSA